MYCTPTLYIAPHNPLHIDRKHRMKYNDYKNKFSQKDKAEVTALPKCYTDQEKEYIKRRLKEEAGKCLIQYGIRRTTVDDIVKRVQIPKGTFNI